jgi:beta-mannosidase
MKKLDLAGTWRLLEIGTDEFLEGNLPGCNYLDLIKNGKLSDPFWGENEETAKEIGEKDYEYSRNFTVSPDLLAQDRVDLVISGLDTLAGIQINDTRIAETDNAHRLYRFDIKSCLKEKENRIKIYFKAPLPYLRKMQEKNALPSMMLEVKGVSHIRKPQCHFGWDWGPILPPSGISGHIGLEAYSIARLEEIRIVQNHSVQKVDLDIHIELNGTMNITEEELTVSYQLIGPSGQELSGQGSGSEKTDFVIGVKDPELWWSNGLGSQPLYTLSIMLYQGENLLDTWEKQIGLRRLTLDTAADRWGNNFRFMVNGIPIFAKGADWIPSDSFVTRTSKEDLEFYIKSAKDANMNMLRVWGGGYYESDQFYDLCDKYGILVWQDFGFACLSYPLNEKEFLNNVQKEVYDNVRRLRHHPSLALWCGNNEIELVAGLGKKRKDVYEAGLTFFYQTLPEWVAETDGVTPYWPGSPSSGQKGLKPNALERGDTHLWQVWHGMLPIEAFRSYPTRFCSEFGMESLPSLRTVRSFTDDPGVDIFSPVMLAHQKSGGGNQKMLFYILAKYRNPGTFEDFIYLSQLIQSETVRHATEQWRRNMGRSNGALYWQYNDCWPVASWAGIDYGKQYKAVQYRAKYFNQMLIVSADMLSNRGEIYVINEYPNKFNGSLSWELVDFKGTTISSGKFVTSLDASEAKMIAALSYKEILEDRKKNEAVLILTLSDETGIRAKQNCLLVPDKQAAFLKPDIKTSVTIKGNMAELTLTSDVYARYVYVEIEGILAPLSDNYFDMEGGKPVQITFPVPKDFSAETISQRIRIKSFTDVKAKGTLLNDKRLRLLMRFHKENFFAWVMFKFI